MLHTDETRPTMKSNQPHNLDFSLIQPQLTELLVATGNWIERSWPGQRRGPGSDHEGARAMFLSLVRMTENSWRSTAFLCADNPPNAARKPEYVLSVPPIARSVLEALCTTIFVFGDLPRRVRDFYRAGWREVAEERDRVRVRYGSDPDWQPYLQESDRLLSDKQHDWGVTDREAANTGLIARFPIPDRMVKDSSLSQDRRDQLQYLLDWHYRKLSQDVHLSWPGLARRAGFFLPAVGPEERERLLPRARADIVSTLAAFALAIISEIEIECRFGTAAKAQYVWAILGDFSPDTMELYTRFYQEALRQSATSRSR
jgi:hypothetical protein